MSTYLSCPGLQSYTGGTGLTQNFLMYGRELSMPVDVMIGPPEDQPVSEFNYRKECRTTMRMTGKNESPKAAERQSRYRQAICSMKVIWYGMPKVEEKGRFTSCSSGEDHVW